MKTARKPAFDHGAALRVPPAHDVRNWRNLMTWLGPDGHVADDAGVVRVHAPGGWVEARPGDWIVLSVSGAFHVCCSAQRGFDA